MCLVDLEKAFDSVPGKVLEWAMIKKGIIIIIIIMVIFKCYFSGELIALS